MPFFLDDGTEIHPDELIIPDKCLKCKLHKINATASVEACELSPEWELNVMCIFTRIEQMDEKEFYCGDYEYNPKWKLQIS